MANGPVDIAYKRDWPLGNPWLWLAAGFGITLWSWLWTFQFGVLASDARVIVLVFGLLFTAAAAWLRWNDRQAVYLAAWAPVMEHATRLFLGCCFALIALAASGLFVATFFVRGVPLQSAPAFMVWITSAPLGLCAARRCFQQTSEEPSRRAAAEETALIFISTAAICWLGSYTLYLGPDLANDWDSIRLVLRVFAAVSLYAAALTVVSLGVRRLMLSGLFILHFMGIGTAVLSAPPTPWIVMQVWIRVYRPYLEFMYLNNAYHFYAPDPGPSSYLWFRLIYQDAEGTEYGVWHKVPPVDKRGALEYQRFLALTESTGGTDSLPPPFTTNAQGQWDTPRIYKRRLTLLPVPGIAEREGPYFRIPLHPGIPQMQQVTAPNESAVRLFSSFARHLAHKFAVDPEHPDRSFKSVKIYRVIHGIPPINLIRLRIAPNDPELYRPFFMGNYDSEGKLIDPNDPYLMWLLPIVRDHQQDPYSGIKDYARLHAGDRNWYLPPAENEVPRGEKDWTDHPLPRTADVP